MPDFVQAYHRARTLVIVCAGLIVMWRFGVSFEGTIPLLGVRVAEATKVIYPIACVLVYGVFRLLIEWTQSDLARRRRLASRIDFTVTFVFAAAAGWALLSKLLPAFEPPPLSLIFSGGLLVALGIGGGILAYLCLESLFLIRPKEEARRLALPRIPVAVRASFGIAYFIVPPILVVFLLAPYFMPPLSYLWPWFLFIPTLVLFASGAIALLSRTHTRPDGTKESRSEFIKRLRKCYDQHDAYYQTGGWDRPVSPHGTPLFIAAGLGETATLRLLLDKGTDPDELNTHGWTPLMIAVAEQHDKAAQLLLEQGANANLSNLLGRNALMFAARYGNAELVRQLIQHGAQVDLNESHDPNALGAAAKEGHMEVVELLLQAGADPTIRNGEGRTAQDYAQDAGHGQIAAILRKAALGTTSDQ